MVSTRIRTIILSRVYKGTAVNKEKEIIRANKERINSSILGLPCYREIYRNGVTGNGVWLNGRGLFKICCSRELLDGHESYVTPRAMHSSMCFEIERRKDKTKWKKRWKKNDRAMFGLSEVEIRLIVKKHRAMVKEGKPSRMSKISIFVPFRPFRLFVF